MIYIPTEFEKRMSSSHGRKRAGDPVNDLNNGVAVLSPLVNGGRVLGGVDPNTGLTFGFDPSTWRAGARCAYE